MLYVLDPGTFPNAMATNVVLAVLGVVVSRFAICKGFFTWPDVAGGGPGAQP